MFAFPTFSMFCVFGMSLFDSCFSEINIDISYLNQELLLLPIMTYLFTKYCCILASFRLLLSNHSLKNHF